MSDIRLVGLDFGTTTSRCVAARGRLSRNVVTGRNEVSDVRESFRSPVVLTPFSDTGLDLPQLEEHLEAWLAAANTHQDEIFGGGALVTGLAAQKANSPALVELLRSHVKEMLVATAGDPCLEAWLAFQANARTLSRSLPARPVINLDIGGGTTNVALGKGGEVLQTGSLFVGARHIEVVPGTYRIVRLSHFAQALLSTLGIPAGPGDSLTAPEIATILDWQIELIESALAGRRAALAQPVARMHEQVPFDPPGDLEEPIYCLSGGVGELVYDLLQGKEPPATTRFGDLGIDLAKRIATSPRWVPRLAETTRADAGRATVYGLLLHATQVSGSTIYLTNPAMLPLHDVPILGRVTADSTAEQIRDILQLVSRSAVGGCVVVSLSRADGLTVRSVGERIGTARAASPATSEAPLVLLVRENVAKALGGYVSGWGSSPGKLLVLDEINPSDARFVQIGGLRDQLVPVSFYGMN